MPTKKNSQNEKLVTPRKSVHVVFFSCPDCGDETHHVEMCGACNTPMRVIDVVEKFGEEGEKFLEKVEKVIKKEMIDSSLGEDEPNIILMGETDDDAGIDPSKNDNYGEGLDVIFPSDGDDDEDSPKMSADADLTSALERLDEEDEDVSASDFGFDGDDIPEL